MWEQVWISYEDLNIPLVCKDEWNIYIATLKRGHVILIEESDESVGNFNDEGSVYTTNLGCISCLSCEPSMNMNWWKAF